MLGTLSKGLIIHFDILVIGTILSCWQAHQIGPTIGIR